MNTLIHFSNHYLCRVPYPLLSPVLTNNTNLPRFISTIKRSPYPIACATSNEEFTEEIKVVEPNTNDEGITSTTFSTPIDKELKRVAQKTAATFAPRASTASKNPAVPGSTLYTVFEVQAYVSMLLGGALSFNLIFPSDQPDIWRLMGMWSIWMFTIPSLRARDCSKNEKEALNYLFLLVPLLNVAIPFFVKSFAVVWSADIIAFFGMYAWKLGWLQKSD
ncbi:protein RESISTANCE TO PHYTOPHTHORA 1, chloroplastic [Trifolium pratense]|uniref:protein RESISTANCE TO PHYTOPHTHORA 1, chloroplastic n=1 Tax=Trifolium pratense TaxID=57577 RepID=UPI001E698220|nr:protein RESISTANCE TO PHYTOPHTHORA 1, chloroplastic [Trifolium pratense]